MLGTDLSTLYRLREDFTIIAITGRIGSGGGVVVKQLEKGFGDGKDFPDGDKFPLTHNSYRKYRIVYNYAMQNFKPFKRISYKDVLTLFILKDGFDEFIGYLESTALKQSFQNSGFKVICEFKRETPSLQIIRVEFEVFKSKLSGVDFDNLKINDGLKTLYSVFFDEEFVRFSNKFHEILRSRSKVKGIKTLQIIANNLRKSGKPYHIHTTDSNNIFTIVKLINDLIKAYRNQQENGRAKIVIDSLRNPLEIMFFKQRFSAFYLIVVSQEESKRKKTIKERYDKEYDDIWRLAEEEYKIEKGNQFYKPFVRDCIEKADIHIGFKTNEEISELNEKQKKDPDNTSPYYSWSMQLLKYVSLISHPGLVTPSPEERCMQLAFTAKYNSGCISRQVGAAITDENYSVKAIGWNNTPEGQVPCSLRNAEDLMDKTGDLEAFTPYERYDPKFKQVLEASFRLPVIQNQNNIKGRNICFCFKTLKNSYSEGKNQVHTRSLHAEESAFLQITKYGGTGIKNGKLFTTASPCELCSKKAYQIGIKVIYYVDPYPGISQQQILEVGDRHPEVRLFNGAIGNAYHWLYEPLMNYKDEQSIILGQDIKDLTTQQKVIIAEKEEKIKELQAKIEELISNTQ